MTSVKQLFFSRFKKGWLYQYKVWKSAIDWVVWLYILLPALAIFIYQYYLLFLGQVEWARVVPIELTWVLLFLLSWTGGMRLFIEEGDLLFLRQQKRWLLGLMRLGIMYSMVKNLFFTIIVFILLYPFWVVYGDMFNSEVALFFVFMFVFRFILQFSRQFIEVTYHGWWSIVANGLFFISMLFVYYLYCANSFTSKLVLTFLLSVILFSLYKKRMRTTWCFYQDCLREEHYRLRLTMFFVGATGYKADKSFFKRTKPLLLFPKSMRIFKDRSNPNLLTEAFLKFFLRNKTRLMFHLQLTGMFVFALSIAPSWVKWLLLPICMFSSIHSIKTTWRELKAHSFFKLFSFQDHEETTRAVKRAICILALPNCFLFGLIVGISAFSLSVGFFVGVICLVLSYYFITKELWLD